MKHDSMIELAPRHKRGLALQNPVMNASGVLGLGAEYRRLIDFTRLGAFVTNALTFSPRTPAHPPNAVLLPKGVMIHTGLPNPGIRAALRRRDQEWRRLGPPVIVHLAATTLSDVARSLERLDQAEGVSGIELGLRDDETPGFAGRLIRAAVGGPPLVVRLPVLRAAELCDVAAQAGADALTVGAPTRALASPPDSFADPHNARRGREPSRERVVAGRLYGPENFLVALTALQSVAVKNLGLPLIGAGGIFSVENAMAMLDAGAAAVQVDAAIWIDPGLLDQFELELRARQDANANSNFPL